MDGLTMLMMVFRVSFQLLKYGPVNYAGHLVLRSGVQSLMYSSTQPLVIKSVVIWSNKVIHSEIVHVYFPCVFAMCISHVYFHVYFHVYLPVYFPCVFARCDLQQELDLNKKETACLQVGPP